MSSFELNRNYSFGISLYIPNHDKIIKTFFGVMGVRKLRNVYILLNMINSLKLFGTMGARKVSMSADMYPMVCENIHRSVFIFVLLWMLHMHFDMKINVGLVHTFFLFWMFHRNFALWILTFLNNAKGHLASKLNSKMGPVLSSQLTLLLYFIFYLPRAPYQI